MFHVYSCIWNSKYKKIENSVGVHGDKQKQKKEGVLAELCTRGEKKKFISTQGPCRKFIVEWFFFLSNMLYIYRGFGLTRLAFKQWTSTFIALQDYLPDLQHYHHKKHFSILLYKFSFSRVHFIFSVFFILMLRTYSSFFLFDSTHYIWLFAVFMLCVLRWFCSMLANKISNSQHQSCSENRFDWCKLNENSFLFFFRINLKWSTIEPFIQSTLMNRGMEKGRKIVQITRVSYREKS